MGILVQYNKNWQNLYKKQAKQIKKAMGSKCAATYHIGATAIKDMPARPVIDILVILKDDLATQDLISAGYQKKEDNVYATTIEGQEFHILCLNAENQDMIDAYLAMGQYLQSDKSIMQEFITKKQGLATQYEHDPQGYETAKKALFEELVPPAIAYKKKMEQQLFHMSIGMCIGCGIGACFGFAIGNVGIGMCIGVAVGMCIGLVLGPVSQPKDENK